jgi:hypothetical protein
MDVAAAREAYLRTHEQREASGALRLDRVFRSVSSALKVSFGSLFEIQNVVSNVR